MDSKRDEVMAASARDGKDRFTALAFLNLVDNLRDVVLQDMAVMMNEEERVPHPLYQHEIFQSADFRTYQREMQEHLEAVAEPSRNTMDAALPGVNARFDTVMNGIGVIQSEMKAGFQNMTAEVTGRISHAASAFADRLVSPNAAAADNSPSVPGQSSEKDPMLKVYDIQDAFLSTSHSSISLLYNEWHGIEEYQDLPCVGGFKKLEATRKAKWRQGYSPGELQRFNKMKRIVESVTQQRENGSALQDVLTQYDQWWKDSGSNPSNMVHRLQSEGHLEAKQRKKRRHAQSMQL